MIKRIIALTVIAFLILVGFVYWGLLAMDIEDRYGDLTELYNIAEDQNLVIINGKEFGFIKRYGREIFVDNQNCMKNILQFSNMKIELYDVEIKETLSDNDFHKIEELKNQQNTKLLFKNF